MSSYPADLNEKTELIGTNKPRKRSNFRLAVVLAVVILLAVVTICAIVAVVSVVVATSSTTSDGSSATYTHAAVAADAEVCSKAGVEILKKGGSAVDAAIAAQLCLGVVNLHSTGIGGGGFMVYYNASNGESYALDFRGVASLNASTYMFNGTGPNAQRAGGLAICTPGEIRGFEVAWKQFGRLEWHELFEPAIEIATNGIAISKHVAGAIAAVENYLLSGNYTGLEKLLAPNGKILVEGDILKRPLLAQTLQDIADKGADYFYTGDFMEKMVKELQENDAILEERDFEQYTVEERNVTMAMYKEYDVLGISAPGGGPVLGLLLNILDGYDFSEIDGLSIHRIVEAMKYTYAQRLKLGDPAFNDTVNDVVDFMLDPSTADDMRERINDNETFDPDHYIDPFASQSNMAHDHGTSHLSVLAENGDAVAMTNSVNNYFGSLIRSETSGVIFDDLMGDFSIPDRQNTFQEEEINYIQPGKRPLSSMTPTILVNDEGVELVAGASGGSRITTAVAQVVTDVLGFSLPLNESISRPRLHHQLIPNEVYVEREFPSNLRESLESRGHKVVNSGTYAVVQGIHVVDGLIHATSDPRKGGKPDGY